MFANRLESLASMPLVGSMNACMKSTKNLIAENDQSYKNMLYEQSFRIRIRIRKGLSAVLFITLP